MNDYKPVCNTCFEDGEPGDSYCVHCGAKMSIETKAKKKDNLDDLSLQILEDYPGDSEPISSGKELKPVWITPETTRRVELVKPILPLPTIREKDSTKRQALNPITRERNSAKRWSQAPNPTYLTPIETKTDQKFRAYPWKSEYRGFFLMLAWWLVIGATLGFFFASWDKRYLKILFVASALYLATFALDYATRDHYPDEKTMPNNKLYFGWLDITLFIIFCEYWLDIQRIVFS